jgi:hypothetical protein
MRHVTRKISCCDKSLDFIFHSDRMETPTTSPRTKHSEDVDRVCAKQQCYADIAYIDALLDRGEKMGVLLAQTAPLEPPRREFRKKQENKKHACPWFQHCSIM